MLTGSAEPGPFLTKHRPVISLLHAAVAYRFTAYILTYAVLLAVALLIGCAKLSDSGPLWPDAPQYANAGAMIHDWLLSGDLLNPYDFARRNYVQYPAFHMPYHPPAYPGLLGLFFSVTGVSYPAARLFVALCLWVSGCCFYTILRRTGITAFGAFSGSLLLLTMPEVARWSRDTMSEIPALALILAATYAFIVWLQTNRTIAYIAAFCLAEAAFLSRFLTAGLIPAWFLWTILAGKARTLRRPAMLIPPAAYLIVNTVFVMFVVRFSKFEVGYEAPRPNTNYADFFAPEVLWFYLAHVPAMTGWLTIVAALAGLVYTYKRLKTPVVWKLVWVFWLASYVMFLLAVGIYDENRYFIYALPPVSGLAVAVFSSRQAAAPRSVMYIAVTVLLMCVAANAYEIMNLPHGMVGYEAVGKRLSGLQDRGNILVATPLQSDLMFRYRSNRPSVDRNFIRADRSLAIRLPSYTNVPSSMVARNSEDVIDIIRRGRVRYVVSVSACDGEEYHYQRQEMALLHQVVRSRSDAFVLVDEHPLRLHYGKLITNCKVFIWKYTGELPAGASEIPVVVPTADMVFQPGT
jgi:hypothetical protein